MESCEIIIPLNVNGTWTGYRNSLNPITVQIPLHYRSPGMVYYVSKAEINLSIRGTLTTDQWNTGWINDPTNPVNQSLLPAECISIKSTVPGNVYDEKQNKRDVIAILTPSEREHNNQQRVAYAKYSYEADLEHATFIELGGNTELKLRLCYGLSEKELDWLNSSNQTVIPLGVNNVWILTFGYIKLKVIPE